MKTLAFLAPYCALFFALSTRAFEAKIKVDPARPFVGESFNIFFHISSPVRGTPAVSFDPGGLTIVRQEASTSTTTAYRAGKFSTVIEYVFSYHVTAPTAKTYRLTDILVNFNGEKKYLANKAIEVFSGPEKLKSYFLQIDTSKENIYLGEGIDVQYYLYSKIPIIQVEIKEYPKLNHFIKRFIDVGQAPAESVNYRGETYRRNLIYASRLYPEKVGNLTLDSIKLQLRMRSWRRSVWDTSPVRTTTLVSPRVKILVKPLPTEDVPQNFTGLVGDHAIQFSLNKSRFLVNEIMEGKFEITGEGLLEKFPPPVLYSSDALEQFDTRSEIIETQDKTSKKVFDYTFIPRK